MFCRTYQASAPSSSRLRRCGSVNRLSFWLKVCFSLGSCALLLELVDWSGFFKVARAADIGWLLVVFVIANADRMLMAYKWRLLLSRSGVKASTSQAFAAYYVGAFWDSLMVVPLTGDIARGTWLTRRVGDGAKIISSMVVENPAPHKA